jgi:putative transport protein
MNGVACVTVLPLLLIGIFARRLENELYGPQRPARWLRRPTVAYATVYPLTTLLRILSAQILAIVLFR